jgi:hypothetical protein
MSPAPGNSYNSSRNDSTRLEVRRHQRQLEYSYYAGHLNLDSINVVDPFTHQLLQFSYDSAKNVYYLYKDESRQNIKAAAEVQSLIVQRFKNNSASIDTLIIQRKDFN